MLEVKKEEKPKKVEQSAPKPTTPKKTEAPKEEVAEPPKKLSALEALEQAVCIVNERVWMRIMNRLLRTTMMNSTCAKFIALLIVCFEI